MTNFANENNILEAARKEFSGPGILGVRMGYVFQNGWITNQRAVVVTVQNKVSAIPETFQDYPVQITGPTFDDLLKLNTPQKNLLEAATRPRYKPPAGVQLNTVTAPMEVIVHVSPEKGWEMLHDFLDQTNTTLTVGMFDFGAPHIKEAIEAIAKKDSFEKMVLALQPGSSTGHGSKEDDLTDEKMVRALRISMADKFQNAWVKVGRVNGWVPSSYHIKVAVRDSESIWLSSGNWQSSNQPDLSDSSSSQKELLNTYNREWHIILSNAEIAKTYEAFLLNDYEYNKEDLTFESFTEEIYFLLPQPEQLLLEAFVPLKRFEEKTINREITATPLLSPDNYFEEVLQLVNSAEHELLIQNQTFNAPEPWHAKLNELMDAVLRKQEEGVDVKIIFRNFLPSVARKNLEKLVEMGFDASQIKVHPKCHTKGVIVDKKTVMVGSQNWSNDGVSVNRDASVIFYDEELAEYFHNIFMHDWQLLATHNVGRENFNLEMRTGRDAAPAGKIKMSLAEVQSIL
jgi:hypothetical protein